MQRGLGCAEIPFVGRAVIAPAGSRPAVPHWGAGDPGPLQTHDSIRQRRSVRSRLRQSIATHISLRKPSPLLRVWVVRTRCVFRPKYDMFIFAVERVDPVERTALQRAGVGIIIHSDKIGVALTVAVHAMPPCHKVHMLRTRSAHFLAIVRTTVLVVQEGAPIVFAIPCEPTGESNRCIQ